LSKAKAEVRASKREELQTTRGKKTGKEVGKTDRQEREEKK